MTVADHLREAEDGVERRAQLVAHVGQELGFGAVRLLGLVLGLGQRHLELVLVGDVEADAHDHGDVAFGIGQRRVGPAQLAPGAVLVHPRIDVR